MILSFVIDCSRRYRIRANDVVVRDDARYCNMTTCILCAFVHNIDHFCARLEWRTNRSPPLFRALYKTSSSCFFFSAPFYPVDNRHMTRCHTWIKMNGDRAVDGARNSFVSWSSCVQCFIARTNASNLRDVINDVPVYLGYQEKW